MASIVFLTGVTDPLGSLAQEDGLDGPEPAYRIDQESADPLDRFEAFDAVSMAVFDLDGDGIKEIVAHNDNNNLYVFDGATGRLVDELFTDHPRNWGARELAGPSIGDVNGNGVTDIVVTNSAGWLVAFETQIPRDPEGTLEFDKLWEVRMDPRDQDPDYIQNHPWAEFEGHPGLDGAAFLADATGDGGDEIYLQLDDMPGLYAVEGDGSVRWWSNWSEGNSNPLAADFTGDGRLEVLYPGDGGRLLLFDARDHYALCTIDLRDHGPTPGSISVTPTVVDLTGDGAKEMVFGVRNAVEDEDDPEWYLNQNAHIFAVTSECEVLWQQSWEWMNPHVHMHPMPMDTNGDGRLDVVFQDWNTVGHKPGNWEVTGPPNLFAVDGTTGNLIWKREAQTPWSNKNLAMADVTGDEEEEILVVEARAGQEGFMLFSMGGETKRFVPAPNGWEVSRGPSVVDLDGDGRVEVLLPIHRDAEGCKRELDVGCREGAIQVYRTPGKMEPSWSNVKVHNTRYDVEGDPLVARGPEVEVVEQEEDGDDFTVRVSGEGEPDSVHVRVPGSSAWQELEGDEDGEFSDRLVYHPAEGEEVTARVWLSDDRVAYVPFEAEGNPVMLEAHLLDRDGDPVEQAYVVVSNASGTVWEGAATSDGRIRIPVEPGSYDVEASASGHRTTSENVDVGSNGTTQVTLTLGSPWILWMGVGGFVAAAGLGVGGFVVKRRRSKRVQ